MPYVHTGAAGDPVAGRPNHQWVFIGGRWIGIDLAAANDDLSGLRYQIAPIAPFLRSPTQVGFNNVLATDVAGPALYKAGDFLYTLTADGHFYTVRIIENSTVPGTLALMPMTLTIPLGTEFRNLPGNRDEYIFNDGAAQAGHRIDVNGTTYEMIAGPSWMQLDGIAGGATSSGGGDVTTAQLNAALATRDSAINVANTTANTAFANAATATTSAATATATANNANTAAAANATAITAIQTEQTTQNTAITTIQGQQTAQDSAITALQTEQTTQNAAIAANTAGQAIQDAAITVLQNEDERPIWIVASEASRTSNFPSAVQVPGLRVISVAEDSFAVSDGTNFGTTTEVYTDQNVYRYILLDMPIPTGAGDSAVEFLATKGIVNVPVLQGVIQDIS